MQIRNLRFILAIAAMCVSGCEDTADGDGDGGNDSSNDSGNDGGGLDCTPSTTDGRTSCVDSECGAGEYCDQAPVIALCDFGCVSELNCASGEYCDLRMPSMNGNLVVGVCRAPGPECGGGDSNGDSAGDTSGETGPGAVCSDVQGNYNVTLSAGSPPECDFIGGMSMCSVAQDVCQLTWGCDGSFSMFLTPGPIDANDMYTASGSAMGIDYNCTIDFGAAAVAFTWSCSATMSGMSVVCEGIGQ